MTTETALQVGQKVEWKDKVSDVTTVHHVGVVVAHDSAGITVEQRSLAERNDELFVETYEGRLHPVPRGRLAPYGAAERARRQRILDEALVAVATTQRALEQAQVAFSDVYLTGPHDVTDGAEALDTAACCLRNVSRTLRLNGAQR